MGHRNAKRGIWIFIIIFSIFMMAHQAWTPAATTFLQTYELSDPPGQLTTYRTTLDFFIMFSIAFVWLIPLSAALMTSYPKWRAAQHIHLILVFILLMWAIFVLVWQGYSWGVANPDPYSLNNANIHLVNPANDKRWCCVYGDFGPPCHLNTFNSTCNPYVSPEMLGVDGTFIFGFIMNCVLVVLLIFEFFWVGCVYRHEIEKVDKPIGNRYIRSASTKEYYKTFH